MRENKKMKTIKNLSVILVWLLVANFSYGQWDNSNPNMLQTWDEVKIFNHVYIGNLGLDVFGDVKARKFIDYNDNSYYCNPGLESKLQSVSTMKLYDLNNTNYYLDLSDPGTSMKTAGGLAIGAENLDGYKVNVDAGTNGKGMIITTNYNSTTEGQGLTINTTGSQYANTRAITVLNNVEGTNAFLVQGNGITRINAALYAKEIFVQTDVFSDYVFDESYELPSLSEVEAFIKENKHLPDVPSEQEVVEEGINLTEMNVIMMQKIEELTLYIIEQQKEIEKLSKKVEELSK